MGEDWINRWPEALDEAMQGYALKKILSKYNHFNLKLNELYPTCNFWSSYLEMVQVMLNFIRATREGNWTLHIASVREMIPCFFAFDRLNYARYLTVYHQEMLNLPTTHPYSNDHLQSGEFSVQRQSSYGFSKVACDQAIEQTINKDSKSKSGWTGFSLKRNAVKRWIMGSHARGALTRHCETMAGHSMHEENVRRELEPGTTIKNEEIVQNMKEYISDHINPFRERVQHLVNVSSGFHASEEIKNDQMRALQIGKERCLQFVEERLEEKKKSVFEPIKQAKLKTFSTCIGKMNDSSNDKKVTVENENMVLRRLLLISQVKTLNLESVMKHTLTNIPEALGKPDGQLVKTCKSDLVHLIAKDIPDIMTSDIPTSCTFVVDGMVVLRQLKPQNIPQTFGELATYVLKVIINKAKHVNANRVDVVWDSYPEISIKSLEQVRRMKSVGVQTFHLRSAKQKVPKNWNQYLASGKNKEAFIKYLLQQWQDMEFQLGNLTLIFAHGTDCHIIKEDSGKLSTHPLTDLQCDHQEADTRLLLHAKHATESCHNTPVVILSPDTDVFVLAIACAYNIAASVFIQTSSQSGFMYNIDKVKAVYSRDICDALLGFHCFTGCDSVSSFKGKGKASALTVFRKNPAFRSSFSKLGLDWLPSEELQNDFEHFTCHLYGFHSEKNIDKVRLQVYQKKICGTVSLPPTQDSLHCHCLRACYQAAIYRRCLQKCINAPTPEHHGWLLENGKLKIKWMTLTAMPREVTEFVQCKCKTGCTVQRCTCKKNSLHCTSLCGCCNCLNMFKEITSESGEEEIQQLDDGDGM